MKKHTSKPVAAGSLTQEQLDAELARGLESLKAGKTYTPDEVDAELAKRFGAMETTQKSGKRSRM